MNKNYALGALLNPPDNRDILLAMVQAPVDLPKSYFADISDLPVEDQKRLGSCVGQAEGKVVEYLDKLETGVFTHLSKRFVYGICKARDGRPDSQGTYPRIAAKVLSDLGVPREALVNDDNSLSHSKFISVPINDAILKDAKIRRTAGYAFVANTAQDIMQALVQNGHVSASMQTGDWNKLPVKPTPARGLHRIFFFGFEQEKNKGKDDVKIWFRNSWGKRWGKNGNGWFWYSEYKNDLHDLMVYTDLPNEIIDDVKKVDFIFTTTMRKGTVGNEVYELQKRLSKEPDGTGSMCYRETVFDTIFGNITQEAVKRYQLANGLTPDGIVGKNTRAKLNEKKLQDEQLFPIVAKKRDDLVEIMELIGKPIKVTDEFRSIEKQNELYAQGRTKSGKIVTNAKGGDSFHNWRCAFDIAFKKGSGITYEGNWDLVGRIGEIIGLEWGGKWQSFQDRPHFQYTAGYTIDDFKKGRVKDSDFDLKSAKISKDYQFNNIVMSKRVKSFLISASSIFLTALIAVIATPEWSELVSQGYSWLQAMGIPSSLIAVIGLVIAEIWKQVLNNIAIKEGLRAGIAKGQLDLY